MKQKIFGSVVQFVLAFFAFSMMSAPAKAVGYGIGSDGYWYNDNATNGTSTTSLTVSMSGQTGTFVATLSGNSVCPCGPLYIIFDGEAVGNTGFGIYNDTSLTVVIANLSIGTHSIYAEFRPTGPNQTSHSATYTVTIRSDSASDPDSDSTVAAIVTAQVALARHSKQQISGLVQHRLELLHGDDVPAFTNGINLNVVDRNTAGENARNALTLASLFDDGDPTITGAISDPTLRQMAKNAAAKKVVVDPKLAKPDYRVWTEGSIIYGEQTASGSEDSSFHTSGLAAGIDTQVLDSVKAGLAVSLVKEKTTIGTGGSYNNGTAVAASLYASWKVDKDVFIDGQAGYGNLDYAINRYDSNAASDMTGDRAGNMFFASVIANYDQKLGALKYAPYAGFDAMAGTLNAYTESGDATYNLGYDSMYIKTSGVVAGVRGQYDLPMAWGTLSPTGRLQYRHAFGSSVTQTIYYDATPATTYSYTDSEYDTDLLTTSLGLKATGPTGISGLIEYLNYTSLNGNQANGLRGMVIVPF